MEGTRVSVKIIHSDKITYAVLLSTESETNRNVLSELSEGQTKYMYTKQTKLADQIGHYHCQTHL